MSKIDPLLIQETIKTINIFNKSILSKFAGKVEKDKKQEGTEISTTKNKEYQTEKSEENEETVEYYNPYLHKKINILIY